MRCLKIDARFRAHNSHYPIKTVYIYLSQRCLFFRAILYFMLNRAVPCRRMPVVIVSSYRDEIAFSSWTVKFFVSWMNKWTNDVITLNGYRKKNHYSLNHSHRQPVLKLSQTMATTTTEAAQWRRASGQHRNTFLITFGIKVKHNQIQTGSTVFSIYPPSPVINGSQFQPMFVHISNNLSGFSAVMRYYKQHFISHKYTHSHNGFVCNDEPFFGNLLKRFVFTLMQPPHKDQ